MSTITLLIFRCRWGAPGHLWSSIGCSGVKWRICKNHFLSTFLNFYSKIKPLIVQKTRLKVLLKGLLKVGIIYVSGWAVLHNFLGARLNTLLRPFHWRGELKQSVTKTVKKNSKPSERMGLYHVENAEWVNYPKIPCFANTVFVAFWEIVAWQTEMKTVFSYSRDPLAVRKGDLYLSDIIKTYEAFSNGW